MPSKRAYIEFCGENHLGDFEIVHSLIVMNEGRIVLKGEARKLLEDVELMEKMGLKPPQVTLLTSKLRKYVPFKRLPLTLEEGIDLLRKVLRDKIKVKVAQIRPQPLPEAKERKGEEIIRIENLWHV